MLQQLIFDLSWVAVEAARDKHVFQAIGDADIAIDIECSDVTRVQPAIRIDRVSRGLGVIKIARHDVIASHHNFAGLVCVADATISIHDGHLYLRNCAS